MNKYLEQIIDMLRKRPGLSAVQLSDLLDIDLEIIENTLTMAQRAEQLEFVEVPGGNGLTLKKYSVPGKSIGWEAPAHVAAQPQIDVTVERKSVVTGSAAVSQPQPALRDSRSKAEMAIAYMKEHGPASRDVLMGVMGLPQRHMVGAFLKSKVKSGKMACDGDVYSIVDQPAKKVRAPIPAAASMPPAQITLHPAAVDSRAAADPVKSPAHYTSGGIELVDILRAKLTPEELRGFFKGNVIKYLLRAEHKNGSEDYAKGSVYATWLAEATTQQAA